MESRKHLPEVHSEPDLHVILAAFFLQKNDIHQEDDIKDLMKALLKLGKQYGVSFSENPKALLQIANRMIVRANVEGVWKTEELEFAYRMKMIFTKNQKALPPGESSKAKVIPIRRVSK
jgi:hypothetical protein